MKMKPEFNGVYILSGLRATFMVIVKQNAIVKASAIARRFIGQDIKRVINWFKIDRITKIGEV